MAGKRMCKAVKWMILLYAAFALVASTLPWIPQMKGKADAGAALPLRPVPPPDGSAGPDGAVLIERPEDAFAVRVALVRSARKTLDIVYYAITPDEAGRAFLGEVLRAAYRGVRVRILVDGTINAFGGIGKYLSALETHPNITCRRYNPMHPLKPWAWHALLHDKLILVDGRYLLSGGRNIENRFFALKGYAGKVTHDRDVLVIGGGAGSVMGPAGGYIARLWNHPCVKPQRSARAPEDPFAALIQGAERMEAENPACYQRDMEAFVAVALPTRSVTLVTNPIHPGKKQPHIGEAMRVMAGEAAHSVILQTPYATANRQMLEALSVIDAGAETVLLTNSVASSPNTVAFSNYYSMRDRFLATGIDIFELQSKDSMHGKSMVIDDHISVVGSHNLDDRSLCIDTENMLVIDSGPFAQALRASMEVYRRASLQVGPGGAYMPGDVQALPVPLGKRSWMGVVSVLSRLLQFLI